MRKENLVAHVQYDDFLGTAAADRHDTRPLTTILEERGLIAEGQSLFAVSFFSTGDGEPLISALLSNAGETNPSQLKEVRVPLTVEEFFATFKRLDISLARKGMDASKEYEIID